MGAHGGRLGHVPCFVRSGAFSTDLEYRGAGNTQKSGKSVSHTEKYAGHAEAHHCGAVFLSGVPVSLWRKSATTVFAVVPAGNLRVIGVFPGAAYTFEIKKEKVEKKGFLEAIRILLSEKNMLFKSLREKLESYPELNSMLYSILFTGKAIV